MGVDEMFPPYAAVLLRERYGHDAVHVAERDLVLLFVLKQNLSAGGAQAAALAAVLDQWTHEHSGPYLGPHWPRA